MSERESVQFEGYYPRLDLWGAVTAYPRANGGFAIFYRDVSKAKKYERQLQESEEKFKTVSNSIDQLAWMTDPDGYITWYNDRWYQYTGTTLAQMQGWGWRAVHHPDHVERVEKKWTKHLQKGLPWEDTFPLKGKDGTYRWFLSRAQPIRDHEGRIVRWFGTNTEIEAQVQIERELREAQNRYKTLVNTIPQLIWTCLLDGRCDYLERVRRFES